MITCDNGCYWDAEATEDPFNTDKQKIVGIDFDETISDNPNAWLKIMETLKTAGYIVYVVTWRPSNLYPEDLQYVVDKGYKVFYTSYKSKREYMKSQGIEVDIVIDDNPWAWDNDAKEIWVDARDADTTVKYVK